jgi:hypothetical protein
MNDSMDPEDRDARVALAFGYRVSATALVHQFDRIDTTCPQ